MKNKKYLFAGLFCWGMVGGCTSSNPSEYSQKAEQLVETQSYLLENKLDGQVKTERLLDLVSAQDINHLIELANKKSPSLKLSELEVALADIQIQISDAAFWPSLSGGLDSSKQEGNSGLFSPSVKISWAADIWGKQRDASRAQDIQREIAEINYQGAQSLLGANIITSYLNLVRNKQLIKIETQRLAMLERNQDIIVNRYKKGLGDLQNLDTARSSTESSRASLEDYQEQFKQLKASLGLLVGDLELALIIPSAFPEVLLPMTSLAPQDLGRRPDLRSAYRNIKYNEKQVSVAYKALLPSLSLSGSLNASDSSLQDALFSGSTWSLLGNLTAPLFQGGKLTAQIKSNELTAEKSLWAYKKTLLSAVNETEKALSAETSLVKRQTYLQRAVDNAQRSFTNYNRKYQQGLVSLIDLLQVQQQTFNLESQLVEIKYQRLKNRITLGLALGWRA